MCVCAHAHGCVSCTPSAQPLPGENSGQRRGHWGSGQRHSRSWEEQPFRFRVLHANPMTHGAEPRPTPGRKRKCVCAHRHLPTTRQGTDLGATEAKGGSLHMDLPWGWGHFHWLLVSSSETKPLTARKVHVRSGFLPVAVKVYR